MSSYAHISYAPGKSQVEAIKAKVKSRVCEAEKQRDLGGAVGLPSAWWVRNRGLLVYAKVLPHFAPGLPAACNQT